jgi:hypothetical protein
MEVRRPCGCDEKHYVQLYAQVLDGFGNTYHVVKNNKDEYICTCPSLLDECDHIEEFKREEANGNIS